jgi:quinol monooxygenase YgiN
VLRKQQDERNKGELMKDKQLSAGGAVNGRRSFVKTAGIGGALALAGGSIEAVAATGGRRDTVVGLVPYFAVNEGKLEEFKALGPKFIALTKQEKGVVYYAFSFSGQTAHCREGYKDAAGVLAHLKNVDAVLKQALSISKLTRLEVHGPAAELEKLRGPLADLKPEYFTLEPGGFRR